MELFEAKMKTLLHFGNVFADGCSIHYIGSFVCTLTPQKWHQLSNETGEGWLSTAKFCYKCNNH